MCLLHLLETSTSVCGHDKLYPTLWLSQAYRIVSHWELAGGISACKLSVRGTENSRTSAGQTFAFPPSASLDPSKVQVKHLTGPERPLTVLSPPGLYKALPRLWGVILARLSRLFQRKKAQWKYILGILVLWGLIPLTGCEKTFVGNDWRRDLVWRTSSCSHSGLPAGTE